MHTSVLLTEAIEVLDVKAGGRYIDATYGVGGHSREIVKQGGEVLALEWDEKECTAHNTGLKTYKSFKLVCGNFADIESISKTYEFYPVDGVLFDLGISMTQIRDSGKGFSYEALDEPLDMRISDTLTRTASDIVRLYSKDMLYTMFAKNADELDGLRIADAIVKKRRSKQLKKVSDLVQLCFSASSVRRVFQALRIEVNHEFDNLKKGLEGAVHIVKKGGRIVVITFHQGEDRIVKHFVRNHQACTFAVKKPIMSSGEYAFERSAKLRVICVS